MRTHVEAWVRAWKLIGIAHAMNLKAKHDEVTRSARYAIIHGRRETWTQRFARRLGLALAEVSKLVGGQ